MPVQDTEEALESVRETVTVQEGSSMEGVILIVGIAVAYYLAKLGKSAVSGLKTARLSPTTPVLPT
tara:strand:- start:30 stop:227 length:198 start_codon:yes stop_codon:yes gene_type:complete